MKVILNMAITINGFIAKDNDDTNFVSDTEWKNFLAMANKIGNAIIGRRTYEIMKDNEEFENMKNIRVIIVSANANFKTIVNNHSIAKNPQDALAILEKEGFDDVLVAGGGTLNASFMAGGLVDEIYLDVESIVFGKGINLFGKSDFETKLKLLEVKKLSDDEVQLHYQVLK